MEGIPERIRTVLRKTFGSGGRRHDRVTTKHDKELRQDTNDKVPTMVPSPSKTRCGAELPPDLAEIVAAWNTLPDGVRAGVLAMVRATRP